MHDLSSPLTFRNGVTAKNRAWLAPLTNMQSHADGTLSDDELRFLTMRAEGGFGVIETCASHIALDGQGWPGELGSYDDKLLPGLSRLASAVKSRGALALVQLFHGGVRAPSSVTGRQPWSASAFEEAREGTEADILGAIEGFRAAAVRAHRAGFDGVELHGAHGYLLSQFLSATMNRRTDRWGDRPLLLRETLRAVRAAVPASFVVGVRISPEDFGNAKGLDLDENLALARMLVSDGIDFLHLSLWDTTRNTTKRPEQHALPLFREVVPREVPIVVAGKVWTRRDAERLFAMGADAVALGRSAIANPDWPEHPDTPRMPPLTLHELHERGLNPVFAEYMRKWKGFVADS